MDARDCLTASSTPSLLANAPAMIVVNSPAALVSNGTSSASPAGSKQQHTWPVYYSSQHASLCLLLQAIRTRAKSAKAVHSQIDLIGEWRWRSVHIVILLQIAD